MTEEITYHRKDFRTVKHPKDTTYSYQCRMCDDAGSTRKEAYLHARSTGHTVDLYTERHTEYTSFRRDKAEADSSNLPKE